MLSKWLPRWFNSKSIFPLKFFPSVFIIMLTINCLVKIENYVDESSSESGLLLIWPFLGLTLTLICSGSIHDENSDFLKSFGEKVRNNFLLGESGINVWREYVPERYMLVPGTWSNWLELSWSNKIKKIRLIMRSVKFWILIEVKNAFYFRWKIWLRISFHAQDSNAWINILKFKLY